MRRFLEGMHAWCELPHGHFEVRLLMSMLITRYLSTRDIPTMNPTLPETNIAPAK